MSLMQYLRANRQYPLYTLLCQLCFFAGGMAIGLIINATLDGEEVAACIGTLLTLLTIPCGSMLSIGGLNGNTRFQLAVSMGYTRKHSLYYGVVLCALTGGAGILMVWLGYRVELALYTVLYPGCAELLRLSWPVVLLVLAGTVVLDLLLSAGLCLFGSRGVLAIWLIFCGGIQFLPRLLHAGEGGGTLLARLVGWLPGPGWAAIGILLGLALLGGVLAVFRRMTVRL